MVVSTLAKALIKQRKLFADILKKQRGTVFSKPKWVDDQAKGILELRKKGIKTTGRLVTTGPHPGIIVSNSYSRIKRPVSYYKPIYNKRIATTPSEIKKAKKAAEAARAYVARMERRRRVRKGR